MINRELIRNKVVQLTYAYYQNGDRNMENAEKELMYSLSKAYDLYQLLLLLMVSVTREASRQLEVATARAEREGTPLPSSKFVDNKFAVQLEENAQLEAFRSMQKFTWTDHLEVVRNLLKQIEQSNVYMEYMVSEDNSYQADRELWRKLYKTFIENNEELEALLEEHSLYWNNDKDIVDTFVIKTIKRFDAQSGSSQELLPEFKDDYDRQYARRLFRYTILNADTYHSYMREASKNWDFSRLAFMDIVIMQIAIAEMLTFPEIPVSVTINEYVELAKMYSTRKSGGYVNGMLDAIARWLVQEGIMLKQLPKRETTEETPEESN